MRRPFSTIQRWPLVVGSASEKQRSPLRAVLAGGIAATGIAACVVPGLAPIVRALVLAPVLLAILGVLAVTRRRRKGRASGASVVADASGLARLTPEATHPILEWGAPFGVTLLASYGRPHALLAFTTADQTRYVPTRIDGLSDADDELFARICVLADLDLVDGVAHDAALGPNDAAAIVRHAEARDREALTRIFLSDGRGAPIALDRATLSIASRVFDLTSRLEWRALMFHESTGQSSALYQATWIRQNSAEVVLVAPMPASIVPREPNAHREATGRLGRALTRDLKLLQAPAEPPPARDVRVAIDRPFMLAVRRILDEAPLASKVVLPAPKPRSAERDSMA